MFNTLNYINWTKQSTLTKNKERKKGRPFPVINKYPERDMLFQIGPGTVQRSGGTEEKDGNNMWQHAKINKLKLN